MTTTQHETRAEYKVAPCLDDDDAVIAHALVILESRIRRAGEPMSSPKEARDYLRLRYASLQHEEFGVLWLDAQNRLITHESLFRGTLTQTSVYPREVVKAALARNAGACIVVHNHPSGLAEPSFADKAITETLKTALSLIDCKLIDHLIVAADEVVSFAERGLL